ncbi:hypothetical protein KK472_25250, partial [Klebsiella pneumoniae]|uniref:hypothetical protein n=1 Tax=Klebsiella pneumoniae TaxID=573 RepID=UPI001BE0748E
KACVLPENPASYRVVRTKSYLFNKAATVLKLALILCYARTVSMRKRVRLIVLPEVWLMLPMATGFIFWIIMQAKNTGGIVIFRR